MFLTQKVGNSALYWASSKGYYAIAKALLEAGANSSHTNNVSKICLNRHKKFSLILYCTVVQDGSTPLSATTDELMKRLIRAYQTGASLFSLALVLEVILSLRN